MKLGGLVPPRVYLFIYSCPNETLMKTGSHFILKLLFVKSPMSNKHRGESADETLKCRPIENLEPEENFQLFHCAQLSGHFIIICTDVCEQSQINISIMFLNFFLSG